MPNRLVCRAAELRGTRPLHKSSLNTPAHCGSVEGRLVNLYDGLVTSAGAITLTRGTDGRVSATTIGAIGTTSTYNSYGEIANFTATGMQTPANYSYTINSANGRDSLGRIIERTEVINSVSTLYDYTYDEAGRLKDVYIGGVLTRSYGYDQNGNRTTFCNGTCIYPAYDDQDRLTSYGNYNYVYTSNGDLYTKTDTKGTPSTLDDEITTYTHDVLGNLTSVALPGGPTITYKYDGRNRLIERRSGGTIDYTLIYNGQIAPVAKYGSGGTLIETYVYAIGSNSPDYIVNGGTNYRVIKDHVGSVRAIVNTGNGVVVQKINYDEFGNITYIQSLTNTIGAIFGFAGGIRDFDPTGGTAATSLTKFGARWYDPMTGRWLEKEPLGFKGSYNFYNYCDGDPVNWVDEDGLLKAKNDKVKLDDLKADTKKAMECFETCSGLDLTVTSAADQHTKGDPHMRGKACDFGKNSNPDLKRTTVDKCFKQCFTDGDFPNAYGQEETDHYHIQSVPGKGGAKGFAKGVK